MKRRIFPFSAVVQQDAVKTALLLNAVDPLIGGVLIRGHKGTGKSTLARSLADLLPDLEVVEGCPFNSDPQAPFADGEIQTAGCAPPANARPLRRPTPFVELPLNATEDRVAGTLHVEKVLATGRRQFEPGLLAAANRGVLYVDEVNLLDDHLVDLLLDAAASGVNVVEREGLSFVHPARFVLIGTMNPEEGELRPQFLDRFGLCAAIAPVADIAARELIVQRRLAFDRDPESFFGQWAAADRLVARQIVLARAQLDQVQIPPGLINLVARLTHELNSPGHRADLTLIKAARAHAAFLEQTDVTLADIHAVASLALLHRLPASPLDSSETLQQRIARAFQQLAGAVPECAAVKSASPGEAAPPPSEDFEQMAAQIQIPGNCAAGSILLSFLKKKTMKPSSRPIRA